LFSTNGAETTGYQYTQMNFDPYSKLFSKIDSIWIIDKNIKSQTTKLVEESTEENLLNLELEKNF
jgi:hypothetical protein